MELSVHASSAGFPNSNPSPVNAHRSLVALLLSGAVLLPYADASAASNIEAYNQLSRSLGYVDDVLPDPRQGPTVETPVVDGAPDSSKLNDAYVASAAGKLEDCQRRKSRFCRINPDLKPIYERVSRETGVPAAIMYAVGEYETHNTPKNMSDGGKSCGLFSFYGWKQWGFASLAACHDPETSIRKLAESYLKNDGAKDTYRWLRLHNGGRGGLKLAVTATYASEVLAASETLYAFQHPED